MARRVAFETTERAVFRNGRTWKFISHRNGSSTNVLALRWTGYRWETVHNIWL